MDIPKNFPKPPTYHRQRFLLALLQSAGGCLSKLDLQKLLFLGAQEAGLAHYDFIPYHYGCYSFQAQSDLRLLVSLGWLNETEREVELKHKVNIFTDKEKPEKLENFVNAHCNLRGDNLIARVYKKYPYYAIHSRIADRFADNTMQEKIAEEKRKIKNEKATVYTIGYEGVSFECYINKLIRNNVHLLCDVRYNAFSRKFGFSKKMLSNILPQIGITYMNFPELGIESKKRKNMAKDYADLFMDYRLTLPARQTGLERLMTAITTKKRVALTCFEAEPHCCHRHCLSDWLEAERGCHVEHL